MEITARTRYLRISPRKVRLIVDVVRGKGIDEARSFLAFASKRAAHPILKLLNSAAANAKHNFSKESGLYIKKIFVDQGPTYKRIRPVARGTAHPIKKKTSHVTIILDERV